MLLCFASSGLHAQVKNVYLLQSVIWEGAPLAGQKIEALNKLRKTFPNEPLSHFISSSYLFRSKEDAESNKKLILENIQSSDTVGLHLTAWKSEVESAGLIFRDGPTFFGNSLHPARCSFDCGQEIPPSSYPIDELKVLISHSKNALSRLGFNIDSLQVQGWMATPQLLSTASDQGFLFDYSGVSPDSVQSRLYQYPIFPWIVANWSDKSPLQQPYFIQKKSRKLLEVGNFMASIDYNSAADTFENFKKMVTLSDHSTEDALIFHISLRMESSFEKIDTFIEASQLIRAYCEKNNIVLVPYAIKSFQDLSKKFKTYTVQEQSVR